jgi:hypothetical protein
MTNPNVADAVRKLIVATAEGFYRDKHGLAPGANIYPDNPELRFIVTDAIDDYTALILVGLGLHATIFEKHEAPVAPPVRTQALDS